jgi:hypothetical protein
MRNKADCRFLEGSVEGAAARVGTGVFGYRGWMAYGIHAVFGGETKPERRMAIFKSYATRGSEEWSVFRTGFRALNASGSDSGLVVGQKM